MPLIEWEKEILRSQRVLSLHSNRWTYLWVRWSSIATAWLRPRPPPIAITCSICERLCHDVKVYSSIHWGSKLPVTPTSTRFLARNSSWLDRVLPTRVLFVFPFASCRPTHPNEMRLSYGIYGKYEKKGNEFRIGAINDNVCCGIKKVVEVARRYNCGPPAKKHFKDYVFWSCGCPN